MKFQEFEPKKPKPKHIELMQERPVYTVQSNADRHAEAQRMMAYKNARSAEQVVPTEVDMVKAFTRYAQTQKVADAAAGNAKSVSDKTIVDIQRARR